MYGGKDILKIMRSRIMMHIRETILYQCVMFTYRPFRLHQTCPQKVFKSYTHKQDFRILFIIFTLANHF